MQILNHPQLIQKIRRLSIEILENNYNQKKLILAGINNNGYQFAELLKQELSRLSDIELQLTRIKINPAKPTSEDVAIELDKSEFKNKVVIIVDDVANTGRTIFFAFKPFMDLITKKIEVAVIIDRMHKSFPIKVDYYGLSLATTLKDNIVVDLSDENNFTVHLE